MPKLTKLVVDGATPRDKQFTIWCSDLKGFGVFVHPSATRTYFVDYRNAQNARRRMTIGRHGTITAEQARKLAIATLGWEQMDWLARVKARRGPPLRTVVRQIAASSWKIKLTQSSQQSHS